MLLFKTSGKTITSVVANQKHAFRTRPSNWFPGEIVLVRKIKADSSIHEKQVQHIMFLDSIPRTNDDEFEIYWPGNKGRWNYIADCSNSVELQTPFNFEDILGVEKSQRYRYIQTFGKLEPLDEQSIENFLRTIGAL